MIFPLKSTFIEDFPMNFPWKDWKNTFTEDFPSQKRDEPSAPGGLGGISRLQHLGASRSGCPGVWGYQWESDTKRVLETTKKKQGDFIRIWRKKQNMNSLDRYCNICFRGNCFDTFKRWLDSTTNVGECSSLSSEKSFPGEDIFVTRSNWKWWLKVTLGPQNFVVP